jgi:hypothetical protein
VESFWKELNEDKWDLLTLLCKNGSFKSNQAVILKIIEFNESGQFG